MKIQAIYKITNIINDKIYVGSAIFLQSRWRQHRSDLNLNKHGNQLLQNAWNKYGEWLFKFEILEKVWDKTKLIEREQYWIDLLKTNQRETGYNLTIIARSRLGVKASKEALERMSKSKIGLKQPRYAVIARALAITSIPRSEETKLKISNSHKKGKKISDEQRAKISNSLKGNTNRSGSQKKGLVVLQTPIIID